MPAVSYTTYAAARAAADSDSDIAIYGPADYRVWQGDDLPDWHIPSVIEYPTAYAQQQHKQIVSVTDYGVSAGVLSEENDTALQTAVNQTALNNQILWFPPGTYQFSAKLTVKDNTHIRGSGLATRLEKHFTTTGTNAFIMPTLGVAFVTADDVTIEDMEIGAVDYYIGETKTNKLMIAAGNRWRLRNLKFNTWTGWALTVGGEDHVIDNITFADPYSVAEGGTNGHDGLHIAYGKNIDVNGVYGVATDDFIAITNPATGIFSGLETSNIRIRNANGYSTDARFIAIGSFNVTSAGCDNISIKNAYGYTEGGINTGGSMPPAIILFAVGAPLTNVEIRNFLVDGSRSNSGIKLAAQMGMSNILFENGTIYGGDIANDADAYAISVQSGQVDNLQFVNTFVDATNTKYAITTPTAPTTDFAFDGYLMAGSDHVIHAFTTSGSAAVRPVFNTTITNIKTGKTGLNTSYATDAIVTMRATKAEGATSTSGVTKTAQTINMTLVDCNFSDVDATYG